MIDRPVTEVVVVTAERFDYRGPQLARVRAISERIARFAGQGDQLPACRIEIARSTPTHHGLGSGTQLSMAVAEGICRNLGIQVDSELLATRFAARGKRSAVGVHGYFQGGLIFEASSQVGPLNKIQQRVELPGQWCVAILCPTTQDEAVHGVEEAERFAQLAPADIVAHLDPLQATIDALTPEAPTRSACCSSIG